MKVSPLIIVLLLFFYSASAQISDDPSQPEEDQISAELNEGTFVPHPRLLQEHRWTRVSTYRFECPFLRLAVEFKDHTYVLMEMDGEKRVLARSINYEMITRKIMELTLNPQPNFNNIQ